MSDETLKEAFDLIAFSDDIHEQTQRSILKKLKTLYPGVYQEWLKENEDLVEKWNTPVS